MLTAGIDAGSRAIKIIVWDTEANAVIASGIVDQGVQQERLATDLYERVLAGKGLVRGDVARLIATGYARKRIDFADTHVTEITCHAKGVHFRMPEARAIIEIGGQDSKVIWFDEEGGVRDFAMNDRCAAGTGRFLEVVAARLETDLPSLGVLAVASKAPAAISNTCIVFAETEIIGLLANGVSREDIVAGVQHSIARRLAALAGKKIPSPVAFAGGVAKVPCMQEAVQKALAVTVKVVPEPQFTGALGAALMAAQR